MPALRRLPDGKAEALFYDSLATGATLDTGLQKALDEAIAKLPGVVKNKATPLVLVCASGMRSGRAVAIARKLGYEQADSLAGGLKSWRQANLPIEK